MKIDIVFTLTIFLFCSNQSYSQESGLFIETNAWKLAANWTNDSAGECLMSFAISNAKQFEALAMIQRDPRLSPSPDLAFGLLERLDGIPFSEAETKGEVFVVSVRARLYGICMNHAVGTNDLSMYRFLAREMGRNRAHMIHHFTWDRSFEADDNWDYDEHPEKRIAFEHVYHTNMLQRTLRDVDIPMIRSLFNVRERIPGEMTETDTKQLLQTLAVEARFSKEEKRAFLDGEDVPPTPLERQMKYH